MIMSTIREFVGQAGSLGQTKLGRGGLLAVSIPLILSAAMLWPPLGGAQKIQMTPSRQTPAAIGTIMVKNGKNQNTDVTIKVQHLAEPAALAHPADVYVVWFQPDGQKPKNEGQIMVQPNRSGELKTQTSYKHFQAFITAETNPRVEQPSGEHVLSASVVAP